MLLLSLFIFMNVCFAASKNMEEACKNYTIRFLPTDRYTLQEEDQEKEKALIGFQEKEEHLDAQIKEIRSNTEKCLHEMITFMENNSKMPAGVWARRYTFIEEECLKLSFGKREDEENKTIGADLPDVGFSPEVMSFLRTVQKNVGLIQRAQHVVVKKKKITLLQMELAELQKKLTLWQNPEACESDTSSLHEKTTN